jgi:predicted aminopeptidase
VGRRVLGSLVVLLAATSGCSIPYLGHVTLGQVRILIGRVSVEDRLEDPSVSAEEKVRLRLVQDVRKFAIKEVGLHDSGSFTTVYDTQGGPAAWNLSASADDAFVPYTWSFPIVGTVPYKGFFVRAPAAEEAAELRAHHQDVLVYGAAAYSTLGWFSDPVFTSMLRDSDHQLANTILHELAHATVYVVGDSDFNETLATFVGNQGAIDYFKSRGGENDPRLKRAAEDDHDDVIFGRAISDLRERLTKAYGSSLARDEKLKQKAAILRDFRVRYSKEIRPLLETDGYDWVLRREINNALILALERYHGDLDVFAALHRKLGSNLHATVLALEEIARAEKPRAALAEAAQH